MKIKSKQPRKQRKALFKYKNHQRSKLLTCRLADFLRDEYGIRSRNQKFYYEEKAWEYGKAPDEIRDSLRHFKTADLKGYNFTLAARWRIDTESIKERDSWIGAYGLDIGLKYARYSKCTPEYENITEAKSNFNYYQIFIVGFVKIRFFY